MEKLFVSYEIALQLKEKGFNEPCLASYEKSNNKIEFNIVNSPFQVKTDDIWLTPLYQQVIDWFREKHRIIISVNHKTIVKHSSFPVVKFMGTVNVVNKELKTFNTSELPDYYLALTKAIIEALKLI